MVSYGLNLRVNSLGTQQDARTFADRRSQECHEGTLPPPLGASPVAGRLPEEVRVKYIRYTW